MGEVKPVLAATCWSDNSRMIMDCRRLGYLQDDWTILDPTFGLGTWWKHWCPPNLVSRNRDLDGFDFTDMEYDDCTFDAVTYDPPYVCVGGRQTTTMPEFQERYGIHDTPTSPAALQALINAGLGESCRVTKAKGFVLVKCQDYISSGKLWIGTHHTLSHGLSLGLILEDRLEHIGNPRPQPGGRRQLHARRNLSTLLVFRKTKGAM